MRVDVDRLLRRIRAGRQTRRLRRRSDSALLFAGSAPLAGSPLLLDTNVYIDVYEGSAPAEVKRLLSHRPIYHLDLVLGELAHNFGRLDPDHPGTAGLLNELCEVFEAIPPERIETASSEAV